MGGEFYDDGHEQGDLGSERTADPTQGTGEALTEDLLLS